MPSGVLFSFEDAGVRLGDSQSKPSSEDDDIARIRLSSASLFSEILLLDSRRREVIGPFVCDA